MSFKNCFFFLEEIGSILFLFFYRQTWHRENSFVSDSGCMLHVIHVACHLCCMLLKNLRHFVMCQTTLSFSLNMYHYTTLYSYCHIHIHIHTVVFILSTFSYRILNITYHKQLHSFSMYNSPVVLNLTGRQSICKQASYLLVYGQF